MRFLHITACKRMSLLFHCWIVSYSAAIPPSIHWLHDRYLDCFYFLDIMNNTATNTHVQSFVTIYVFISLGYIPNSGIGHIVNLHLIFKKPYYFPKCLCYFTSSVHKDSHFSASSSALIIVYIWWQLFYLISNHYVI